MTVSAGVAQAREGMTARELLREADEALYGAKHAGRDRVVLYEKNEVRVGRGSRA